MADLTAADVTVTMVQSDFDPTPFDRIWTYPTISFGNGVLEYPTNGVPLPDAQDLGMRLGEIKRLIIIPPSGSAAEYRWDDTNHSIEIWPTETEHTHSAVAATTLKLMVLGR